ncbi:COP1-interacting protein 7 [Malania oleifera]|uniref:COP1-interacting protein 7 n=1 Tax=Malania oleifera TaxID=397392 RepID=UPI0025AE5D46|nr:COP1-interacting protein 7 [Malania oleifera]
MKSGTRLNTAFFQLTPTRTRCDLIISANGKTEKMASGLLNPFLAHLKTAQDQIAKGGYSIVLEPEPGSDATWFTKGTVERFVRFVSTPEVLERVYTIESEILQIQEAIAIQSNCDIGLSTVEDHQAKSVESIEGCKPVLDADEEKAIVLYKPGSHQPEANGSNTQEGNSKVQLLRVLETRKTALQKEQGMAFARAVAAGFDIDHMAALMSFADCFGALRLMDACLRFMDLWKGKHETGQWLEIEAAEAMSGRQDFVSMNASGIMLSNVTSKQKELREGWPESRSDLASENNGKANTDASIDDKAPTDHQVPIGNQEYMQGQFPHPIFPPWPINSPAAAMPIFQSYPVQGMPYYPNYPMNSPYFQPPYQSVEDFRSNAGLRMGQRRHSMDSRESNTESEPWELNASKTKSRDDLELEKEVSQDQEPRKKASRSGRKHSGVVVIRNINYITPNKQNSSDSESQSASDSEIDGEGELEAVETEIRHKNHSKSSKNKGSQRKSVERLNSFDKDTICEKEVDGGHWQAFQNCLLRSADEDKQAVDQGMFAMEKEVQGKRRQIRHGEDLLVIAGQDTGKMQEGSISEYQSISGNVTRMLKPSNDEMHLSRIESTSGDGRGSTADLRNVEFTEIEGRRGGYRRTANDNFMIHGQDRQPEFSSSSSDPLALTFEHATNHLDKTSTHSMADESFIVPLRSGLLGEIRIDERNAIDIDSELPLTLQKLDKFSNRGGSQVNYEPDDLSLVPERGAETSCVSYDPALDYEMQVHADTTALGNRNKEAVTDVKQVPKKLGKDQRPKVTPDASDKKKIMGATRKGKPSKLSPLDEARARAERLRTFKADLQKLKKENEKEEIKRLEALKMERQKRIAARSSSIPASSPMHSQQSRKQLTTKLSPSSHKGSKFSDSEPGSSSPLQRASMRATSLASSSSPKTSKASRSNNGSVAGNTLSRSASSLPQPKKENKSTTPDPKASMARIRRLSEPKMSSSSLNVSSVKLQNTEAISKPKLSNDSESMKISAIMNLDRTKAATLPELKVRTSKEPSNVTQIKPAAKEMTQKVNESKSSMTTASSNLNNKNNDNIVHHNDMDDNPVIEKTVVMLECGKPTIPAAHASEEKAGMLLGDYDSHILGERTEIVSEYAAIRAPVSPLNMDVVDREPIDHQLQEQPSSHEVKYAEKESPHFSSISTAQKPYQAPYARVSSLEEPCTGNSEYGKAPPTSLEMPTTMADTTRAIVSDSENLKLERIPEALEKSLVKESSKGFRRLLKFGRKNHSSATGDHFAESDNASVSGSEAGDNAANVASSSEVHTLKNLISHDETPTAIASQKASRSFSLLSPFRSKNSGKKLMT